MLELYGVRGVRSWTETRTPTSKGQTQPDAHATNAPGSESERGKPSANIKWTNGSRQTPKTPRKPVKMVATPESHRGDRANVGYFQVQEDATKFFLAYQGWLPPGCHSTARLRPEEM